MAGFSSEHIYGINIRESANDGSDFSNPDADYRLAFLGEDGLWHVKDSSGTVTSPYTGGSLSFSGARVYNNAAQTVTANTETTVLFNTEDFDTASYHDTGSNTGRMTVPSTGYYRFNGLVYIPGASTACYAYIRKQGTTTINGSERDLTSATDGFLAPDAIVSMTAGQYCEIRAYRFAGTTFGITTAGASCAFEATFLGA